MTTGLDGRVVLVTGAGNGLGREHALLLARHGARVVVNDIGADVRGEGEATDPADQVVSEIEATGGVALANHDSVATVEGGESMVAAAVEEFGRIDAVVHNAGVLRDRSLSRMTPEEVEVVLDVHLRGGFHVTLPAFRRMKEQGHGRIVLTTSASGLLGNFGQANYAAAKMGLVGLARVAALEGARHDVHTNVVAPSARTRMTEELLGSLADALDPARVSPLVGYLCSSECSLNGEIFSAGGGRFARVFVGVALGWYGAEGTDVEDIAANLDAIRSTQDFIIPEGGADEVALLRSAIRAGAGAPRIP